MCVAYNLQTVTKYTILFIVSSIEPIGFHRMLLLSAELFYPKPTYDTIDKEV